MFKSAVVDNLIRVNNPSIWRPILSIPGAVTAYGRAIEAPYEISAIFNVASGNFTVGEVADIVLEEVKSNLGITPRVQILDVKDYRNYKVTIKKASDVLSIKTRFSVVDIVRELCEHRADFGDFTQPKYYNIEIFKKLIPQPPVEALAVGVLLRRAGLNVLPADAALVGPLQDRIRFH